MMDLSNYMRNRLNFNDNAHSDNEENVRGGQYRHKKFTVPNMSEPDNVLDLSRSGSSTPREMWRPRQPAYAPQPAFGQNQPAFGLHQDFVPQQVAQPPPRDLNANPFLLANMPQQRYVPRDVVSPGHHQEQPHRVPPAQRTASPVHDFCE